MTKAHYFVYVILICLIFQAKFAFAETSVQDRKASAVYAQHLFTSICSNNYRNKFPLAKLNDADANKLIRHTNEACACQYTDIVKTNAPEDIVDYVMYTYGKNPNKKPDTRLRTDLFKLQTIAKAISDKNLRKKCGFVR